MFARRRHWRLIGRGLPIVRARRGERIGEAREPAAAERAEQRRTPRRGFPGRGKPAGA